MLTGVCSGPSIVYIDTLVLERASRVEHAGSIGRRLCSGVIEECFRHGQLRVVVRSHCWRPDVEVGLDQFLFAVRGYREPTLVCLGRGLLEVVLMQGLVVSSGVCRHVHMALVLDLKVVRLKELHKVSFRLDLGRIGCMHELLLLSCGLLELVVGASDAEVGSEGLVLGLDDRLSLALALLIEESFLGGTKEGPLELLVAEGNVALLELIFDIFVLSIGSRGCISRVFHRISQTSISSVCCLVNRLVFTVLDVNSLKFVIEDVFFLGITAEVYRLEVSLGRRVQSRTGALVDIGLQKAWSLIFLGQLVHILKSNDLV